MLWKLLNSNKRVEEALADAAREEATRVRIPVNMNLPERKDGEKVELKYVPFWKE